MDSSINRFRKDSSVKGLYDYTLGYSNPCVGLYYYKGGYRKLFQFKYTPRNQEYAPEYVYYNGHKHYVIKDSARIFSHVE